jgi:acetyl esterase/lipase
MIYTRKSTPKEILKGDWLAPYKGFFFKKVLDSSEMELPLETLCEMNITINNVESLVKFINILRIKYEADASLFIPIWEGINSVDKKEVEDIVMIPFLIEKESPCYIVCPGGGYACNALPHEGIETAVELNKLGVNAVILTYRVAPYQFPKPQQDLIRAIQIVRANKELFHVKDNKVVIMGYSAAGHLCGSVGALYDQIDMPEMSIEDTNYFAQLGLSQSKRPDAIILNYPVVSFVNDPHVGSADNLLGEEATYEKRKSLSVEYLVNKNYPPTFIWHCEGDVTVLPSNSIVLNKVLGERNIPHEFHLFPEGEHGCGLAIGTKAEGWISCAVRFVESHI